MIEEYIGLLCKEEDIALIKKATGNPYKNHSLFVQNLPMKRIKCHLETDHLRLNR